MVTSGKKKTTNTQPWSTMSLSSNAETFILTFYSRSLILALTGSREALISCFNETNMPQISFLCCCNAIVKRLRRLVCYHRFCTRGRPKHFQDYWFILLNMAYSVSDVERHPAQIQELHCQNVRNLSFHPKSTLLLRTYQSLFRAFRFLALS